MAKKREIFLILPIFLLRHLFPSFSPFKLFHENSIGINEKMRIIMNDEEKGKKLVIHSIKQIKKGFIN